MTSDKNIPAEPPEPQKKGGGDGNAKSAAPKSRPAKTREETNPSAPTAEPATRSRKITSRG